MISRPPISILVRVSCAYASLSWLRAEKDADQSVAHKELYKD
jgi:hypothetical protein